MDYERQQELLKIYSDLKEQLLLVDDKYSLTAKAPPLNMPESLNLKKLEYVPVTEEELLASAQEQAVAAMIPKQRSAQNSYTSALTRISEQKSNLLADSETQRGKALDNYNEQVETIERKVVDNGLYFSTVGDKYKNAARQSYNETLQSIGTQTRNDMAALEQKEVDAKQSYDETLQSLKEEEEAKTTVAFKKLADKEEQRRLSIEKYNNGLEEKEQKYQASRAKAYEAAYRAQQNKALQNAKIYAELGETGYRDLIEKEKYGISQTVFYPLKRSEAMLLLSLDSFMVTNLGNYYSAFVEWVNTVLVP